MKKFMGFAIFIALFAGIVVGCYGEPSAESKNNSSNRDLTKRALNSVEIPLVQYFLERQAVADWFKNWDQPGKISYLYIFTAQGCIGYFVVNGKPISNRSYLLPEYTYTTDGGTAYTNPRQAPSLDGTFGEDLTGIRFKMANGTWAEFGGTNFSYIYADRPMPGLSTLELTPNK